LIASRKFRNPPRIKARLARTVVPGIPYHVTHRGRDAEAEERLRLHTRTAVPAATFVSSSESANSCVACTIPSSAATKRERAMCAMGDDEKREG